MTNCPRILSFATAATVLACSNAHAGTRATTTATQRPMAALTEEGPYVRMEAGASFISGANLRLDLPYNQGLSGKLKFKPGFAFGGAVGYRVSELAAEVELDETHNKFDSGPGTSSWGQSLRQTTLMGNVYWVPKLDGWSAWLGGGIGAQFQSSNISGQAFNSANVVVTGDSLKTFISKKSDSSFTGQLKAGISVPIFDRWTFDAGYKLRFVGETDIAQYDLIYTSAPAATPVATSTRAKLDHHLSHLVTAGFGYQF